MVQPGETSSGCVVNISGMAVKPRTPSHLRSTDARRLWSRTVSAFELSEHHLALLDAACSALDRLIDARAAINRDGITVEGRYGARQHPAVAIERDSRTALARLVRDLGLDVEPTGPREPGRSW